jgi:DNA-binding transcriptional MerR regulator
MYLPLKGIRRLAQLLDPERQAQAPHNLTPHPRKSQEVQVQLRSPLKGGFRSSYSSYNANVEESAKSTPCPVKVSQALHKHNQRHCKTAEDSPLIVTVSALTLGGQVNRVKVAFQERLTESLYTLENRQFIGHVKV